MTIGRGIPPLLLLSLLASGCSSDEPPRVQLAPVSTASVSEVVEAPGTVAARATATLTAPAAGTVAKLYVIDGQTVKKGELLARIDSPQAKDQLKQARKADKQASAAPRTRVPVASVRLAPLKLSGSADAQVRRHFAKARAAAKKIGDKAVRDQLIAALDAAQAQHRASRKALSQVVSGLNRSVAGILTQVTGQLGAGLGGLSDSMAGLRAASRGQTKAAVKAASATVKGLKIKAPFAGVVTLGGGPAAASQGTPDLSALLGQAGVSAPSSAQSTGPVAQGVPVAAGQAIATVTDVSELTLSADVDETDVLLVKEGARAEVEFDAVTGAAYEAEVTGVGVTPKEGATGGVSYPVHLTLADGTYEDGSRAPRPKPGMSAVIRLTVREAPGAVAVPASAIVSSGRESVVWTVVNGRAERRVIRLGAQGDANVQVLSGVTVGDKIVVRGADTVRAGQELP